MVAVTTSLDMHDAGPPPALAVLKMPAAAASVPDQTATLPAAAAPDQAAMLPAASWRCLQIVGAVLGDCLDQSHSLQLLPGLAESASKLLRLAAVLEPSRTSYKQGSSSTTGAVKENSTSTSAKTGANKQAAGDDRMLSEAVADVLLAMCRSPKSVVQVCKRPAALQAVTKRACQRLAAFYAVSERQGLRGLSNVLSSGSGVFCLMKEDLELLYNVSTLALSSVALQALLQHGMVFVLASLFDESFAATCETLILNLSAALWLPQD
jgi:hypothetical protein